MNEFKFRFVNVLFFFLLLGSSYWAFQKMNPHFHYTADDVVSGYDNVPSNGDKKDDIDNNSDQQQVKEERIEDKSQADTSNEETGGESDESKKEQTTKTLDENHRLLLTKLQGLIDDKIYMKKGSHGTRVGTVQKFLNLYFEKQIAVDNEYGPNTMYRVRQFQQKENLSPDGFAGPETYKKMIQLIKEGKV